MNKPLLALSLTVLAACSSVKERSTSNSAPVAHNTVVECVLYDGMKKESAQLATVAPGTEVQVTDTIDAYFVKARVKNPSGQEQEGYMYRTCFSR